MLPLNPWEYQNMVKSFYSQCVEEVCEKHNLTRMELDILLFLANNPRFDTAADIVEIRYLSKSQVSISVGLLEKKGFLKKCYTVGNRKSAHLVICDTAKEMITDGQQAQENFLQQLFAGLTEEEKDVMKHCMEQMRKNIRQCSKTK